MEENVDLASLAGLTAVVARPDPGLNQRGATIGSFNGTFCAHCGGTRRMCSSSACSEEALSDLAVRSTLLRLSSGKDAVATVAATLGLAAAGDISNAGLPALLYGSPAIAATVAGAAEALQRRPIRRAAERNAFYFLYEGIRLLDG